jgi:hypothetical protein
VVLEVRVQKYLDSSLIDVDVHPTYVSMVIKSKVGFPRTSLLVFCPLFGLELETDFACRFMHYFRYYSSL